MYFNASVILEFGSATLFVSAVMKQGLINLIVADLLLSISLTLSVSVCLSLSVCLSVNLSVYLSLSLSQTHTHTHTHTILFPNISFFFFALFTSFLFFSLPFSLTHPSLFVFLSLFCIQNFQTVLAVH
jgi:hypothetical protein